MRFQISDARKPSRGTKGNKSGRGTRKHPVAVIVERGGNAKARVVPDVKAKTLKAAIKESVEEDARLNTDDFRSYRSLRYTWLGGHEVVRHAAGEYARGDVHTNTAESFFALLKRGVHGTFHNVSKKHLHRYVSEFTFRWNNRRVDDGERTKRAIKAAVGKRLMYREPVARRRIG